MIHNLARYTAAQHQHMATRLAAQRLQDVENQRRIQELISKTYDSMMTLHTGMRDLMTPTCCLQRKPLKSLRQRPKPLGSQSITKVDFEQAFAVGVQTATAHSTRTIPDSKEIESQVNRHDEIVLESKCQNLISARSDCNPQISYHSGSSNFICKPRSHMTSHQRIVDQR